MERSLLSRGGQQNRPRASDRARASDRGQDEGPLPLRSTALVSGEGAGRYRTLGPAAMISADTLSSKRLKFSMNIAASLFACAS